MMGAHTRLDEPCELSSLLRREDVVVGDEDAECRQDGEGDDEGGVPRRRDDDGEREALTESVESVGSSSGQLRAVQGSNVGERT